MMIATIATLFAGLSLGNSYTYANEIGNIINFESIEADHGEPFGYRGQETDCILNKSADMSWLYDNDVVDTNLKYYCFDIQVHLNWVYEDGGSYYDSGDLYGYDVRIGVNFGNYHEDSFLRIGLQNGYLKLFTTHLNDYYQNIYYNVGISNVNDFSTFHYFNNRNFIPLGKNNTTFPSFGTYEWQNFNNYYFTEQDGVRRYAYNLRLEFYAFNPDMFTNTQIYNNGYIEGYNDAINSVSNTQLSIWNLFGAVADFPHMVFSSLFDYPIWGVSIVTVLGSLLAIVMAVWVIRKLI